MHSTKKLKVHNFYFVTCTGKNLEHAWKWAKIGYFPIRIKYFTFEEEGQKKTWNNILRKLYASTVNSAISSKYWSHC